MSVDSILKLLRGAVRPVAVFAIIGGVIAFLATGLVEEAKYLAAFGQSIVAWWFIERMRRAPAPPE